MKKLILTFLSKYREKQVPQNYTYNKNEYPGAQTNEAPLKCLLKEMSKRNDEWQVLCIVSHEVFTHKIDNNQTQYDFYKKTIRDYNEKELKELNLSINVDCIAYKFLFNKDNIPISDQEVELSIYHQLNEFLLKHKIEEVYIDFTGGLRDTSYLLVSIIQYMETREIKCKKIIYSNLQENTISDLDNTYNIEKLISGIREFINTGNAVSISNFFEQLQSIPELVKEVLDNINSYAFAMSVINTDKIEEARNNLQNSLRELEKEQNLSNLYAEMFKALSPVIREKMLLDGEINYPKMIKWCLDNRLIQQAVTLYIEKMPFYYYDTEPLLNNLAPLENVNVKGNAHDTKEYQGFYTDFYDKLQESDLISNFKQVLSENLPQEPINGQSEMENIKDWQTRVLDIFAKNNLEEAFNNLSKLLDKYYDPIGFYNNKFPDIEVYNIHYTNKSKNYIKFLNLVISNPRLKHYCVFNKKESYIENEGTYTKKTKTLECIKDLDSKIFSSEEEREHIAKILYAYLCVKIIRNRLNHAKDKKLEADEEKAISILRNYVWKNNQHFIDIEIDTVYDNIKRIIEFGLSLSSSNPK